MKVSPYLYFNGNAAEAIVFYEKAFGVKEEIVRYKDAPPSAGYEIPQGTENNIMHASLTMGQAVVMLCDMPANTKSNFGDGISIMLTMDNIEQVKSCFDALKEGGEVGMEPQETFWTKCFCSLTDKFGIGWMLDI
jgi:PhnB protein